MKMYRLEELSSVNSDANVMKQLHSDRLRRLGAYSIYETQPKPFHTVICIR